MGSQRLFKESPVSHLFFSILLTPAPQEALQILVRYDEGTTPQRVTL